MYNLVKLILVKIYEYCIIFFMDVDIRYFKYWCEKNLYLILMRF